MLVTHEDLLRMERAHVRAWPALRTANIDGWLWRSSGGGSRRANSVSALEFTGTDPQAAIRRAEARYHALGARAQFQSFDGTSPPELPNLLRKRGYQPGEPSITMFKRPEPTRTSADVEIRDHPATDWRDVYLAEISENRRAVNAEILNHIPTPRAFFGYRRDKQLVSTALCVIGHGCAVIECVATRSDFRRRGASHAVLTALQAWAARQDVEWIGLQVVVNNVPAGTLYQRLGFTAEATNSFWVER